MPSSCAPSRFAFCCLADFTSSVESKRKLVGAVGIETTAIQTKRYALTTLHRTRSF
jgi:hypothetical protein